MCDVSLEDRLLNAISDLEAEGNECEAGAVRELWAAYDKAQVEVTCLRGLLAPAANALNFMVNEQHSCPLEHFEDFEKVPYCEVPEMEDVGDCSSSPAECWKMHLNGWCGCDLDKLLQIAKQVEVEDDREVDAP